MKKAILVVSFGTSYLDTLEKTIENAENQIRNSFSEYDIYRAFTSHKIIKKLKEDTSTSSYIIYREKYIKNIKIDLIYHELFHVANVFYL